MPDDDLRKQIRNSSDIVEVIGERVPLKKAGKNFVARCPFHQEKTPSFNVSPERQQYDCFGCSVGGDVFGFLMAYDKVSFPEAMRALAERAGIPMVRRQSAGRASTEQTHDALYQANALARDFFVETLSDPRKGAEARLYLQRRGLTEETVARHGIGYAVDRWDALLSAARGRGLLPTQLVEAGLSVRSERGQGSFYDRFRGRVTFPVANEGGRVVAFGARTLDPQGEPKYFNSAESPIYRKSRTLYGLFHAREAIRQVGRVLVVEGYMDVLQLMQAGIDNVVATCGTALTREHGELLRRHSERLVLVFDGDEAGVRAALRAGDVLLEAGIEPLVVLLPEGDDPDTIVAAEGPDSLRSMADQGTPYLRFKWNQLSRQHDMGTTVGRNAAVSEMLDSIAPVADELTRSLMAGQVAEWGAADESLVSRAVARRRGRRRTGHGEEDGRRSSASRWNPPRAERELIWRMLDRPGICRMVGEMGVEHFTDPLLREMAAALVRLEKADETPSAISLLQERPGDPEWSSAVGAVGGSDYDENGADWAVADLMATVRLPQVTERINALRVRLRSGLSAEERSAVTQELVELQKARAGLRGDRRD